MPSKPLMTVKTKTTLQKMQCYNKFDVSTRSDQLCKDCMREMLLEGKKIRLGDLGDFSLLLTSKGAEDADKFTAQNITGVKVQWEPEIGRAHV